MSRIRAKIGHDPIYGIGASIILHRDGKVLLQRRADDGLWAIHGGGVEPMETVEDAARRELYEETGLRAGELRFYGVFSGPELHKIYPNGDEAYIVCIVYLCDDFSGEPILSPEEVTELRWFPIDALPRAEEFSQVDAVIMRDFSLAQ